MSYNTKPLQLVAQILNKKSLTLATSGEQAQDFVLKVCGQDEYLVGDVPLIQFLYIQEMIARDLYPVVVTIAIRNIPGELLLRFLTSFTTKITLYFLLTLLFSVLLQTKVDREGSNNTENQEMQRTRQPSSTNTQRKKGKHLSSWSINEPFQFEVKEISRLNCNMHRPVEVGLRLHYFMVFLSLVSN